MEDQRLQSHSFMPLLSRVDRLDSVITYIEKKEKLSRWRKCSSNSVGKKDRKGMAVLKVAAQEAHSKGSLMDRILSLEDRLVQLSQEIESSSRGRASSSCSMQSTSLWTNTNTTATYSSSGGSKTESSLSSYPTFTFPINPERKPESEFQKKQHYTLQQQQQQQQRLKQPSDHMKNQQQQQQKGRDGEEEKTCKIGKKKKKEPLNWPRFKLLGC